MKIWVDADACPVGVKEILFRAAERTRILMTLVANQPVWVPPSPWIKTIQVSAGSDIADQEIVKRLSSGELVITADIPLAAQVIEKGGHALNPRGELYTEENIRERLNIRDFMDGLRASGIATGSDYGVHYSLRTQATHLRCDSLNIQAFGIPLFDGVLQIGRHANV